MIQRLNTSQKGFTIVEMILYVAILAILLTVITNTLLIIGKSYGGLKIQSRIATAASVSFEKILGEARGGASVYDAGSIFNSTSSVLSFLRVDGTQIRFYVANGRLYYEEGGTTVGPLTPASITVDSFFVRRIDGAEVDGVKVDLTLGSSYKTIDHTESFHVSALVRN